MNNRKSIKYHVFNIMAIVLAGLSFAENTGERQGMTTGAALGTAVEAASSEFLTWWKEISAGARTLQPGIYDIQPEGNPYFFAKAGNESLTQAKEFVTEHPNYVCAMSPNANDGSYIILDSRPEPFDGEIHGESGSFLLLDAVGDAVLVITEPLTGGKTTEGTTSNV